MTTPTYQSWHSMLRRCTWHAHKDYPNYGGRGIKLDTAWLQYAAFLADMGPRPPGTTLERIDNSGDYKKSNCRWATYQEQNFNRRPYKKSQTGIVGVCKVSTGFRAYAKLNKETSELYRGPDLFEACCARKSWELRNGVRPRD